MCVCNPGTLPFWSFNCHCLVTCLVGAKKNKLHNDNDSSTGHRCAPCAWSKYGNVETFSINGEQMLFAFSAHFCLYLSIHPSASLSTTVLLDHTIFSVVNKLLRLFLDHSVIYGSLSWCSSVLLKYLASLFLPILFYYNMNDWINEWMCECLWCMSWVMVCMCLNIPLWTFACHVLPCRDHKEINSPARRSVG